MNQPIYQSRFQNRYAQWVAIACFALVSCSEDAEPVQVPPTISGYEPTSQLIGQTVTINGNNFGTLASAVTVTFYDGEVATIKEITNTKLVVTVPDNAFVGPISIKVKEMEVEGSSFEVLMLCNIWVGGEVPQPVPCPRQKRGV